MHSPIDTYFFVFLLLIQVVQADHYRGGTLSWKPVDPTAVSGPTVDIYIIERHSWTFDRYPCNSTIINSFGVYNDTQASKPATLTCISSSAACTASAFTDINEPLACTDASTFYQISTGSYFTKKTLNINSVIDVASRGASWTSETHTNSWSLVTHIDLTPIDGKINTSPVSGSLPLIKVYTGISATIQINVGDVDNTQVVRCRWSYQTPLDECGSVCFNLPNAQINTTDCFIRWTPVFRPEDIAVGANASIYVVALTVEDFVNATSTTPLSSVPHQMLVHVSNKPAAACAKKPTLSGFPRRNLACYGVSGSITYNFIGRIDNTCPNDTIVDFISSSPLFTNKLNIIKTSNYTWQFTVQWTPTQNQTGLQPFCVAAVDNNGQTSDQYCVMIMVGSGNPAFYASPKFLLSTAAPIGTVMSTQTRFSIQVQSFAPLRRTTMENTFINIYRKDTNGLVYSINCKTSSDVYFLNKTIVFFVTNPSWILDKTYTISMSEGVATADQYCGIEADYFPGRWSFTIWKPALSLTTTPSTTTSTATTHTVTTRYMGTTTFNTLYTTTGIPAITKTTTTSTTSTTATTVTTTTTTSASTTTTTTTTTTEFIPNADVIYPKDMERQCLQPITIATVLVTAAALPLHLYAMITLFTKMNASFQSEALKIRNNRRVRLQSAIDLGDEGQSFV